jgi:hypothetical protein
VTAIDPQRRTAEMNACFRATRFDDFQRKQATLILRKGAAMQIYVNNDGIRRQLLHPLHAFQILAE